MTIEKEYKKQFTDKLTYVWQKKKNSSHYNRQKKKEIFHGRLHRDKKKNTRKKVKHSTRLDWTGRGKKKRPSQIHSTRRESE